MQKITPCLWFDTQAEEAAKLYTSIFKNSKIKATSHYPEGSPAPTGSVMTVVYELDGQEYMNLNAGPIFKFTEAISFVVNCDDQAEVDYFWEKLTADGGEESQCGWLRDKFGLSWQITPKQLNALMSDPDPKKASNTMQAMLTMKKLDLAALQAAHDKE